MSYECQTFGEISTRFQLPFNRLVVAQSSTRLPLDRLGVMEVERILVIARQELQRGVTREMGCAYGIRI